MERKSIPKPVRIQVWNKYIGEEHGIGKCNVCSTEIKVSNFDCGHIIAACEGGEDAPKKAGELRAEAGAGRRHRGEYDDTQRPTEQ